MADLRRNLERQMILQRVSRTRCSAEIGVYRGGSAQYYDAHLTSSRRRRR